MFFRNTPQWLLWSAVILFNSLLLTENTRAQDKQDFYYCRAFDGQTTYFSAPFPGINKGRYDSERAE